MSKRKAKGAASAAPTLPDLTVRAVVTVRVEQDGLAHVVLKVDMDGADALVDAAKAANRDLQRVGAAMRVIVMQALGTEPVGPATDFVASSRVGRA